MIACDNSEQVCNLGVWFQWQLLKFRNLAWNHYHKQNLLERSIAAGTQIHKGLACAHETLCCYCHK